MSVQSSAAFGRLVGASPAMREVYQVLRKAAKVDLPTLIIGETGTGKELAARELHARSARANGPFIAVNTGALPHDLIASELFGHKKGAFTSAHDDKRGRFEEANGGTLFLDEIASMDDRIQVALLRVLENNVFRPVGAKQDRAVDVRLVAASNEDLDKAVAAGAFREDLLFRLRVLTMQLPPLRDHAEDIPHLAERILEEIRSDYGFEVQHFTGEAMEALKRYDWPGNVRELRNVVAQAAVMTEQAAIELEHLPRRFQEVHSTLSDPGAAPLLDESAPDEPAALTSAPAAFGQGDHADVQEGLFIPLGKTLDEVQRQYALKTLEQCENNKTKAAETLGVSRKTLYDRLHRWGIA